MSADRRVIEIAGRRIGVGEPTYIIAEMSGNHGQNLERAMHIVKAAALAGADAVKLQTYTPDTMTLDSENADFLIDGTPWHGRRLYELYGEAYTPWEWHSTLQDAARSAGVPLFSTPFDPTAVDFLETLGVPAYKIASFECVDVQLLRRVARTGRPVIVSTGMATLAEIEEAVTVLRAAGCEQIGLLKCTSSYPAPAGELNLRAIPHLEATFGVPVGFSDHTVGPTAAIAAVALGATIIEKHITVPGPSGPDGSFSIDVSDFEWMVRAIREAEVARGTARYGPTPAERSSLVFRRSLFVVEDVAESEVFTTRNVRAIRPGTGLHTRHLDAVLGRRATRAVERGTPLAWDLVGGKSP